MERITQYIATHSNGKKAPICGSEIARAFNISAVEVRRLVNEARCAGNPICACRNGYYITKNKDEIQQTIDSIRSRISGMSKAISGLENCLGSM